MKPIILHTRRSSKHFPDGSSGYRLTRSGWEHFTDVESIKTFQCNDFEFLPEYSTIRGVSSQSNPEYVTVEEMRWLLLRAKNYGYSLEQIVKASEKNIDAFRLLAFLEVAHYQTSLAVELDKENRTLGFDPDFFLGELSKVRLYATL